MSDTGAGGFLMNEIIFPVWDTLYEIMFRAIDGVMNNQLKRANPDLDPQLSQYGKGSRLFLSYITITLGSVVGVAIVLRLWILFDALRR